MLLRPGLGALVDVSTGKPRFGDYQGTVLY